MDESIPRSQEDREAQSPVPVEQLPEHLGFVENDELRSVRTFLVEAMTQGNWVLITKLKSQYLELGQAIAKQHEGSDFARAQIGLIVATGLMWRDAGKPDSYGAELYNAHMYAYNIHFDEVAESIQAAMAEVEEVPVHPVPKASEDKPEEPDENYLEELNQLAAKFDAEAPPVQVEVSNNDLIVNDKILESSDGAGVLWRALTEGRDVIMEKLKGYRAYKQATDPYAEISYLIPLNLMRLGNHPKDVLSPSGMKRKDHFEQHFFDIKDFKEEFHPFWQAVEASGFVPEVHLYGSQSMWYPLTLWTRVPITHETEPKLGNA